MTERTERELRGFGAFGVLLVLALQWGCAANRVEPVPSGPPGPVVNVPRSERGNPPFYEVFGRRYYVLNTSAGYREKGVASWYGRDFHGLSTSSGERYDMNSFTAAHPTLPIPTWVEVTNLSNGKRVIVKVNDRGPFVDDRIIDLSYAAARELDMVRAGTARVEVRALGAPAGDASPARVAQAEPARADREPARPAQPPPASARPGLAIISPAVADTVQPGDEPFRQMFVQAGAFRQRDNALKLVARLKADGLSNAFVVSDGAGAREWHRVRLGPLSGAQEFDRIDRDLRRLGVEGAQLVMGRDLP